MNHDDTHLNPKPTHRPAIDALLEGRIVAWVAGEASPAEIAELEKLVAAQPALAEFKREMELAHRLVGEAARADAAPLQLAPERRAKLLQALGVADGAKAAAPAGSVQERVTTLPQPPAYWSLRGPRIYFAMSSLAAACLVGLLFYRMQMPELYEAKATLQFQKPETVVAVQGVVDASVRSDFDMNTHPQVLKAAAEPNNEISRRRAIPANTLARGLDDRLGAQTPASEPPVKFTMPADPLPAPTVSADLPATFTDRAVLNWGNTTNFNAPLGLGESYKFTTAGAVITQPKSVAPESAMSPKTGPETETLSAFAVSEKHSGSAAAPSNDQRLKQARDLEALASRPVFAGDAVPQAKTRAFLEQSLATASSSKTAPDIISGGLGGSVTAGTVTLEAASAPLPVGPATVSKDYGSVVLGGLVVGSELKRAEPVGVKEGAATRGLVLSTLQEGFDTSGVTGATAGGTVSFGTTATAFDGKKLDLLAPSGAAAAPAESKNEVVRLEAFTVSAPPSKAKALVGAVGRALSNVASTFAPTTPVPSGETSTAQQPISTFSLHVSDVSFRLATAAVEKMTRGENVPEPKIRAEEFYNAFDYGDPSPGAADKVAARIEQSAHPFLQQRNFVRIGMKVGATGRSAGQPLRLTVLLDTSGSMEREDRSAAVRRALEVLVSLLGPNDRLTLIGFARQPRLLAEDLPGDRAREALAILARTPAEGGTNIEAALQLGGELARRHLAPGAQNRIVVLTDGAANLGDAEPARLTAAVETLRQQGIAFDACGVGLEGTGDAVLEALTRKGNGRYYALSSAETADATFARQLAGAFRPAAENVKLQVRFNPARVGQYRLIGFDEHRLKTEDFRNDAVDAAELAAEEAAVALYQVQVLPQGTGELGEVFVRFRDAATGEMVERSWSILYEPGVPAFAKASPSLRLAGVAALLAEKFLETPLADQFKLGDLAGPVSALRREYPQQPRVQELVTMFDQVRQLTKE